MLTAGVAAHAAADWVGLDAVERFRTRFTAQVWPGDIITATGEVTAVREGTVVEADIVVRNQDDEAVLTGSVVARLPREEG
jgi:acyl dehydratase